MHFYTKIIKIDSFITDLHSLPLKKEEKEHLISLVDSHVHHTVLEVVLSELQEEDKKILLKHVVTNQHEIIVSFITSKIENVEEKIKTAVEKLLEEFRTDIKELIKQ